MDKKKLATELISLLEKEYPGAVCSLSYKKDYELLFATRLAAQCTDERVNMQTPALYARYPSLEALAAAELTELEEYIRPLRVLPHQGEGQYRLCKCAAGAPRR